MVLFATERNAISALVSLLLRRQAKMTSHLTQRQYQPMPQRFWTTAFQVTRINNSVY